MKLFAKVLEMTELKALAATKDQSAIPAAKTFRLSIRSGSKLASASIYWLTLPAADTDLKVGDTEELDSADFYASERETASGNTIKVLKSRNLEII